MSKTDQPTLATLRKRSVSKASITRLNTWLKDLESRIHKPPTSSLAQRMLEMVAILDADFKNHTMPLSTVLMKLTWKVSAESKTHSTNMMMVYPISLCELSKSKTCSLTSGLGARKIASHRLSYLKNNLSAVSTAVHALTAESAELHLLHQCQEQLSDFKKQLGDVCQTLLSLGVEDELEISTKLMSLTKFSLTTACNSRSCYSLSQIQSLIH